MFPQYKDYNYVKVTLKTNKESYVISNVNTKGIPDAKCGAHLKSLDITEALAGAENAGSLGASGSITISDYGDAVFSCLNQHMQPYAGNPQALEGADKDELLPEIEIEIRCFTNIKKYFGHITDWNLQFSGTIPDIQLNWTAILPSNPPTELPPPGRYYTPKGLVSAIKEKYKDDKVDFVMLEDDSDAVDGLKFINEYVDFDLSKVQTCENKLVDTYQFIVNNSVTTDGKAVYGKLIKSDKYAVSVSDPQQNSYPAEETDIVSKLIFVQNGKYKEYTEVDKRYVIPMTSFSYKLNMYQLPIQRKIVGNLNGTMTVGTGNASVTSAPPSNMSVESETIASSNNSAPITVSFECYNTMAFSLNNTKAMVKYDVYNELGKKHILSGGGMPSTCSYSLSGGVIKANVECTEAFNDLSQDVEGGSSSSGGSSSANMSSSGQSQSYADQASYSDGMNAIDYLKQEDENPISLSKDRTATLLYNGTFDNDVNTFLYAYGSLYGGERYLDSGFIRELYANGNYGLMALLLAVANYGISNPESNWTIDAVNKIKDYSKSKPFCASETGKAPYEREKGGLGIAHWDDTNLIDIYKTVGFTTEMLNNASPDREYFEKLLVTDNSITNWAASNYKGIEIAIPVFNKRHPAQRNFDDGLRQNAKWRDWAYDRLFYKDDQDRPVFQYAFFEMWVTKFWIPSVDKLKKCPPMNGHTPCLQDAVRISRAGNSKGKYIDMSCGRTVAEQYVIYENNKERYIRQKAFCRRCADIIGWLG